MAATYKTASLTEQQTHDPTHLGGKVEVHVRAALLHFGQQLRCRCAQDGMDLLDLVQLVGPREEGEQGHDLKEHAAHSPHVHLVVIVAISQEALGCAVPPGQRGWHEFVFSKCKQASAFGEPLLA